MQALSRSTAKDGFRNKLEFAVLTGYPPGWEFVQRFGFLRRRLNRGLINNAIYKIKTRPHAFSTMAPYTSWESLTDRSYSGRHLPPVAKSTQSLPPIDDVVQLFARKPGQPKLSAKSTLLFSYFAQWFTDGFLRTDRTNMLKNTSNHEIDLCQLYGLKHEVTDMVRSHQGGKLRSQIINGEEYPVYYYDQTGAINSGLDGLELIFPEYMNQALKPTLFAMGVDRANVHPGYVIMNTLFLREHNRICDELARAYPEWDDERLFQTARNILIVLVIKIVVEEYINHITPYHFKFALDAEAFRNESWYRQNWMSVEFSLVYRWHGLVPDHLHLGGKDYPIYETLYNNDLVTSRGLGAWFEDASLQPAGEIGLFNTPHFLLETEQASIELGRMVNLASYNDYRAMCRYPRVTAWNQITKDVEVQHALRKLYGHVDNLELYVGLFAEDVRPNSAVSPLIGRLVGIDAFSQAFTNPLLAANIFNEGTFSRVGMRIIAQTKRLGDMLHRNIPNTGKRFKVSMTQLKTA